jgi:Zn-dependent protease
MNDSVRLGSPFGIRLGVHWSVLLIAWLLASMLATGILPASDQGLPLVLYWIVGLAAAAVFFASLLAHELAHAVLARRAGIRVDGITLWMLGGVARLDGTAATPGQDLRIAIAGPLVSGLLGIGFGALTFGLLALGAPPLVIQAAAWLAGINLMLGLFNLLPGAPLDGGRIVRALAWRFGRDRLAASLLATRIGRLLGFGLFAFGVVDLLVLGDLSGLWTMAIGMFVSAAATAEGQQEVAHNALDGATVADAMRADLRQVPGGLTVDVLLGSVLLPDSLDAALVVEANGSIAGVVTLARARSLSSDARRETRVRDVAEPIRLLPTATPDEPLLPALERARALGRPLLVIDRGLIAGMVEGADVARLLRTRASGVGPSTPRGAHRPIG